LSWREKARTLFRIILGLIFVLSSSDNLFNPSHISEIITAYSIIPARLIPLMAIVLPWLEFICGIMLIANVYSKSVLLILLALLFSFTGSVSFNLARGLKHACGCFEIFSIKEEISIVTVIRNIVLILVAIFLYRGANNVFIENKNN